MSVCCCDILTPYQQILTWIDDVGNMFLITNNSIGVDIVSSEHLVKRHDTFDMDSEVPVRTTPD